MRSTAPLILLLLSVLSAFASPEERAQLFKSKVLRVFAGDGWQLTQETASQLSFEREMTGAGGFFFQALTTGAHGTRPVARLSITFVPETESETRVFPSMTMTSQNAFGQVTSIPSKNRKDVEYVNSRLKAASAMLPEKYRHKVRARPQPAKSSKQ